MFYQGIDKVSQVIGTSSSAEDDLLDEHEGDERDTNPDGAEGGDAPAEAAEDPQAKDDAERDDDGGKGEEKPEMTDEELAVRCRDTYMSIVLPLRIIVFDELQR